MRTSRDMSETSLSVEANPTPSGAAHGRQPASRQALQNERPDLLAVGAALRLTHDLANQRAECLHVARAYLLGGRGIAADRPIDRFLQPVAERAQASLFHDRAGLASAGHELVENLSGRVAAHLALAHHRHKLGQALRSYTA